MEGLKAYTQKHCDRLDRASDERFVLVWALEQMDGSTGGDLADGTGAFRYDLRTKP